MGGIRMGAIPCRPSLRYVKIYTFYKYLPEIQSCLISSSYNVYYTALHQGKEALLATLDSLLYILNHKSILVLIMSLLII